MGRHHRNGSDELAGRNVCLRCHRPQVSCVCQLLPDQPAVDNRTAITIVQHPRERFHPKGTVPLAQRGLTHVQVVVAHFDENREPTAMIALPPGTGLLYPHERSAPLAAVPPAQRPAHLVLLDGTWGNAHRLYRSNPWLGGLPHFHLEPEEPGRYRIRGEPDPLGRSTIEAIIGALRILEPETAGLDRLGQAFDAMIDAQVAVIEREAAGSRRRVRFGEPHPVHAPLVERHEDVVLVYTESVACADGRRRPVHWVALRPASGRTFERFLRNDGAPPNPNHLAHMELTAEDLAGGVTDHRLALDWREFLGPTPLVAAWSQSTLNLVAALTNTTDSDSTHHMAAPTVLIKAAYCNLRRTTSGTLASVLEREGLHPFPTPFRGRAGRRIGQVQAVLELIGHP
jgi:tRNA-uridine aminocarboxypropyltransferase